MHINAETYHTIFLSPAETGQLRVELTQFFDEVEVDIQRFPAIDRLTDAILHGGTESDDHKNYSNEI